MVGRTSRAVVVAVLVVVELAVLVVELEVTVVIQLVVGVVEEVRTCNLDSRKASQV